MRSAKWFLLVVFLLCAAAHGFAQQRVSVNLNVGAGEMELTHWAMHGGLGIDWMYLPYLGSYARFDVHGLAQSKHSFISVDWGDNRQPQLGDASGMDGHASYNISARSYSVGMVFAPLAIKWPHTRHLLLLRVDGGMVCFSVHQRWQDKDGLGKHFNAVFYAGYAFTGAVELSYSYRVLRHLSLGAYANLRIMPQDALTGGVVVGVPIPLRDPEASAE